MAGKQAIQLKKGFDILIEGAPGLEVLNDFSSRTFAVKPPNFRGISPIPKVLVEKGDEVKAGDELFFCKKLPQIKFVAPVSGEIVEIKRGAKRAISEIVILADNKPSFRQFERLDVEASSKEQLREFLLASGCWPFFVQRPYGTVADYDDFPRSIFISAFNTAPLSGDLNFTLKGQGTYLQRGIDALTKLVDDKVHISFGAKNGPSEELSKLKGVEKHYFSGPHPAGLVGIQIHHIKPINKGEIVWTIHPQDVATIGKLLTEGIYDTERLIAVGGPLAENPAYIKTRIGASAKNLFPEKGKENCRLISGDVLSGTRLDENSPHLDFYHHNLSLIAEGREAEFFGWLLPSYRRPTISGTFPFFNQKKPFNVNTNMHGEPRAFVMSGEYEKVLPMDIYPVQLLKSIIAGDLDLMEGLGIYELLEEDLALCEFVCTSKNDVQKILREGLDLMIEQG